MQNIHILIIRIAAMCTYRFNQFAHPSCTSLFILLFIKSLYTVLHNLFVLYILFVLHFLFYCTFYALFLFFNFVYLYLYIYALVLCYLYLILILYIFFCTVHWADLTWFTFHFWLYPVEFSMWRINKPWTLNLDSQFMKNHAALVYMLLLLHIIH